MLHIGVLPHVTLANVDLHASGIPDPPMQKSRTFDHRSDKLQLALKTPVDHFETGNHARNRNEPQLRKTLKKLHGPPHILKDRSPMRLRVERNVDSSQASRLAPIKRPPQGHFQPPPDM